MKILRFTLLISTLTVIGFILGCNNSGKKRESRSEIKSEFAGSESCKECHQRFYELWAPSHHGKAMQPINNKFLVENSYPNSELIKVGDKWYKVIVDKQEITVSEHLTNKTESVKQYKAVWTLGGRNISYFLTPMSGGRLQTLPLAYDENRKEWYSTPASAMRHFPNSDVTDQELPWTHSLYTFNTTCHSCHVSQLENNYNLESNSYHTTWKESGINCETCHGPSQEHVRVCREAGEGNVPEDLKLIVTSTFTPNQHNSSCSSCHAKMNPVTASYPPGEDFWQHFNLITLEDPDFYPDGRDLGENYTYTTWMQSKCVENSEMHCVTCHTSSGRYRFKGEKSMDACVKCHKDKVENFETHTHHPKGKGVTCISCHMPTTEFARMTRSDHSMRPPMPAATIKFKSPNACNNCHTDKSAEWANKNVTQWHGADYQKETLYYGELILDAKNQDWKRLDEMLSVVRNKKYNVVIRNSLIRLFYPQTAPKVQRLFLEMANDSHPLIRSSAVEGLRNFLGDEASQRTLLKAASDEYRIVRIAAATLLASYPINSFSTSDQATVKRVFTEYQDYLVIRPDSWGSHYNQGNFYHQQGDYHSAISSFNESARLQDDVVQPLVNASMSHSMLGNFSKAEENLLLALKRDPDNAAANFNYGLLLGQQKRFDEAIIALKKTLKADPHLAPAAYNLAVITAQTDLNSAIEYSQKAWELNAQNARYGYTYAFYLQQNKQAKKAISVLRNVLKIAPDYSDAYQMIISIYNQTGDKAGLSKFVKESLANPKIDQQLKLMLQQINM